MQDGSFESRFNDESINRQPKIFLKAHLPNCQHTSVEVIAGLRLCDALMKALKRRNLTCEMCEVTAIGHDKPIDWDTDISSIGAEEIYVKVINNLPIMIHISHQFVRKTFLMLTFCECCRRHLFTGFLCTQCNYRFHSQCAHHVPSMCREVDKDRLARSPDFKSSNLGFSYPDKCVISLGNFALYTI